MYTVLATNSLIAAGCFVFGLLSLLVSLSLKLVLSIHKTSQSLDRMTIRAKKSLPASLKKVCENLNLSHDSFVITSHKTPVAVTVGLFFPKIIFSSGLIRKLTYKELEAVVLHEIYHQRHKHGLMYIFAEAIALAVSFILPVLKDVTANMKQEFENMADRYALQYQGSPIHIASALNKLSGQTTQSDFPSFATEVERRLVLLHFDTPTRTVISNNKIVLSISMLIILSIFASVPVTKTFATLKPEAQDHCSQQNDCSKLCVNTFTVGMSKPINYSSILPASVF
jgi:Zn-dependent protease with chaperone function